MAFSYSLTLASLLVLFLNLLALNVSRIRMQQNIVIGDGGHKPMIGALRAHGNALETALPLLILYVLLEAGGLSPEWLLALGAAILVSRVAHALGMLFKNFMLRRLGALISYVLAILMPVLGMLLVFSRQLA